MSTLAPLLPKGTSGIESASFAPLSMKVGSVVRAVARSTDQKKIIKKKKFSLYFEIRELRPCALMETKFHRGSQIHIEITRANFGGSVLGSPVSERQGVPIS